MTTSMVRVEKKTIVSADSNYQGFRFDTESLTCTPTNNRVKRKWAVLERVFPDLVQDRSVLDIGANHGFFCFMALAHGARGVIGIERNPTYYAAVHDAIQKIDSDYIREHMLWKKLSFPEEVWSYQQDVVIFISMIHHVYPKYNLDYILSHISRLASHAAIVEFVCPEDKQVQKQSWAGDPEYTEGEFLRLSEWHFGKVSLVGDGHHPTRHIYLLERQ